MKILKSIILATTLSAVAAAASAREVLGYKTYGAIDEINTALMILHLKQEGAYCYGEPTRAWWLISETESMRRDVTESIIVCANGPAFVYRIGPKPEEIVTWRRVR